MSHPDVDSELERLFSVTRAETEPSPSARARIRAALDQRLTVEPAPPSTLFGRSKLLLLVAGVGAALGFGIWGPREPPRAARVETPLVAVPASPLSASSPAMAAPPSSSPLVSSVPAPVAAAPSHARPSAPSRSVVPVADPGAELALIAAMQSALRAGNAASALALAGEHAQRFPRGALAEEREGVRAVARCRLADPPARPALGAAFLARYGSSPYAARVRDACR